MVGYRFSLACVLAGIAALALVEAAPAQGISDPTVRDSGVGYIDVAIPMTTLRLRYDAQYQSVRANRAEFFYPQGGRPGTPGLPFDETNVDFQEFSSYVEWAPEANWSLFGEIPMRLFNGQVNDNTAGLGDISFGGKYALLNEPDTVLSAMVRMTVPTGDADRGLGTNHFTLEPGILFYQALTEHLILEGELRGWIPMGGTFFAGNILRYGAGLSHRTYFTDTAWVAPVGEVVAWTVLDGKERGVVTPAGLLTNDASGDTIVNAKVGVRVGLDDVGSLYVGYGRALTGDVWYRDTVRVELRLNY